MILLESKKSRFQGLSLFQNSCIFVLQKHMCTKYTQKHNCLCNPFSTIDPHGTSLSSPCIRRFVPIMTLNYKLTAK